jgi:hypothetical protein
MILVTSKIKLSYTVDGKESTSDSPKQQDSEI